MAHARTFTTCKKKKKIFHLKKVSDLIHSSGNALSDCHNAVFQIGVDRQKSDLDSDVEMSEFPSPEPEIHISDDEKKILASDWL